MNLNALYSELILEHSRNQANKRHLDRPTCRKRGHNPSCGDDITIELQTKNGRIMDAAFTGSGCAISQASTSIMVELIRGQSIEEAQKLAMIFLGMIKKEIQSDEELDLLDQAIAFQNISNMPARVKCAVLAWHTLNQAIQEETVGHS